jgi:ATP-dependent Clp protease ATP-binding subunit ClpB
MTSNIGSHLIQEEFENKPEASRLDLMESSKVQVLGLLKKTVRPEFLNRIDEVIMFTPLNESEILEIVSVQLETVKKRLAEQDIKIEFSKEALESIGAEGFDPQFGARPVKRVIQRKILNSLSKEILAGSIQSSSSILVDAFDGKLVFRNK